MSVRIWGIVGTGPSGRGIAQLVATQGLEVIMVGRSEEELEQARRQLDLALQHEIEKWALTQSEKRAILARISMTTDINELAKADFVIATLVVEIAEDKEIFRTLDQVCRREVILASNTSTLSITEMASATNRPDKVIGCHFLQPIPRTRVVQVVRGLKTSDETVSQVMALMERLGRTGVEVFESPGYITTRLIVPLINEACQVLMEGVASAEDIDTAMRLGFEMPRGPLEIADRIGLDTVLVMAERLWREYGDLKYRPAPILKKLVRAGHLGVETGEGFFKYDADGARIKNGRTGR
ncbi:3-hydroxyacyl-CoA dehydrogenase family protein [Symbiobacterium thermophilum]|uniref:3-hydroxybutyryl-CoA dehydrogenase n=1 Tax=Symbiobacterium thermophilum (strain DSM 24528 / JCM 14929 / IAM 14863 / T) TaxID=292459 RepID=Q67L77_SYMTH|nr:3-hydroxyacyl-CoA dehydrogenase NAD-binding domain-containing protein [Symbiobacterium thermophilum]BAD41569.1 3-hydroxybutyryl-CoA dehydrogenase [Symbiobacterium thermophilum IAM 14863]